MGLGVGGGASETATETGNERATETCLLKHGRRVVRSNVENRIGSGSVGTADGAENGAGRGRGGRGLVTEVEANGDGRERGKEGRQQK